MQPGRKAIVSVFEVLVFNTLRSEWGHNEANVGVEDCHEVVNVCEVYEPFHLHQPRAYNGVHHEVEDGGGDGAALGNSALGFEDPTVVPYRPAV